VEVFGGDPAEERGAGEGRGLWHWGHSTRGWSVEVAGRSEIGMRLEGAG
jgi:hypothetical protein